MKALVTGARGTVGTALVAALEGRGVDAVLWDRDEAPPSDLSAARRLVDAVRPDAVFHLANPADRDWTAWLAEETASRGVRLLFTSTAMVFTDNAVGPFTVNAEPDAVEGYGGDKRAAEDIVAAANPGALIVRLGWQIGDGRGGNQMVEHLAATHEREGCVAASTRWLPACSFLVDTAAELLRLTLDEPVARGLYHLDSNRRWNYYEIVVALNRRQGSRWTVEPSDDFVYDQRMPDDRVQAPPLSDRLPDLPQATP